MQKLFLPKSFGEWGGTMNLTEPSAGSDVGDLLSRRIQPATGLYRIKGLSSLLPAATMI
jgi:alkylation response protein AidB-like acyl-CoA dehydrogenase